MVTALKKEVQSLRQIHDAGSVNAVLAVLRQHIARAAGIFDHDPHATLAALGKTGGFKLETSETPELTALLLS